MHNNWCDRLSSCNTVISTAVRSIPNHIASQSQPLARNSFIMKKITFESLPYIIALFLSMVFTQPVYAHGGEPRLEISVGRLNPGSALEIRGVDFAFGDRITLALIGSETEIPLAALMCDVDGVFLLTITLPVDLAEGIYFIRATTYDHEINSPQIMISGVAAQEGGGQGEREEDDGLLAPMPTYLPAVPTVSAPPAAVVATPAFDWKPILLVLITLMLIGIIVVFGPRMRRIQ